MLFLAIEHFKNNDPTPIRARFVREGRMLPEHVAYHASWVDAERGRCFQIMEAADRALLDPWIDRWADLIDFEITPVETSQDYWANFENRSIGS